MLYSIDDRGSIVEVSDHWLEVLGYKRSEVIGRKSIEFLTEESRRYAEEVTLPKFFKSGSAKNVPYQFLKKNGDIIDVLLSATSERDEEGNFIRSLAVLVDITERKRSDALRAGQNRVLERLVLFDLDERHRPFLLSAV